MCEFVSWIEFEGNEYFLQNSDLETKEGRKLIKYLGDQIKEDLPGHGAIRYYYPELKDRGINKECTDFSTPKNFPYKIVKLIKAGKMSRIGICLDVLNKEGKKAYKKVKAEAWEAYKKVEAPAWEAYKKVEAPALEAYKKVKAPALEAYKKVEAPAWEAYKKVKAEAFAKIVKQAKYRNRAWK